MPFNEQLPQWDAPGVEPPASKKSTGWQAGEKPPADYWNWQMHRTYKALQELQQKAVEREEFESHASRHAADGADPLTPEMIGAETPAGAQTKADQAETNAKAYADATFLPLSAGSSKPLTNDLYLGGHAIRNMGLIVLTGPTDWNTILDTGVYYVRDQRDDVNAPWGQAFNSVLIVHRSIPGDISISQLAIKYQGGFSIISHRVSTDNGSTWSPWRELITSAGGQTINGSLTVAGGPDNGIIFTPGDGTTWLRAYGSINQIRFARVGGSNEVRFRVNALIDELVVASTGQVLRTGSGSPEGNIACPPGSLYLNSAGGAGTTFWVKRSGTGNTGWFAVA